MKRSIPLVLLSLAVVLAAASSEAATWRLSTVMNSTSSILKDPTGNTFKSGPSLAWGAQGGVELGLSDKLGLELGLGYEGREFTGARFYGLEIPVVLRHWILDWASFGGGAYYFNPIGNASVSTTGGGFVDAGFQATSDLGLLGSLRFDVPVGLGSGLVIEARYQYGFDRTQSTLLSGYSAHYEVIQALIGLRLGSRGDRSY